MDRLFKHSAFTISGLTIFVVGAYLLKHQNYLDSKFPHWELFDWLDSPISSVLFILIGVLTIAAVFFRSRIFKISLLIINAATYAMFGSAFLLRDHSSVFNMTWIFAFSAVATLLVAIYHESKSVEAERRTGHD